MKRYGYPSLLTVVTYSIMGVLLSSGGGFFSAFLCFLVAGLVIAYYDQALQTEKALTLAKECLAGWKEALGEDKP